MLQLLKSSRSRPVLPSERAANSWERTHQTRVTTSWEVGAPPLNRRLDMSGKHGPEPVTEEKSDLPDRQPGHKGLFQNPILASAGCDGAMQRRLEIDDTLHCIDSFSLLASHRLARPRTCGAGIETAP